MSQPRWWWLPGVTPQSPQRAAPRRRGGCHRWRVITCPRISTASTVHPGAVVISWLQSWQGAMLIPFVTGGKMIMNLDCDITLGGPRD